jgi:hypothetical protein
MQMMSDITPAKPRSLGRSVRVGRLGAAAVGVGIAVAAALPAGQAVAAIDPSSPGTTIANVDVGSAILLRNLTESFTLAGFPGDSPFQIGAVTMNVETNNASGYNVTVEAAAANLVGTGTNSDVIPVSDLSVRETTVGTYEALSNIATVQVHNQDSRSTANTGDNLSNDYEFSTPIPNVRTDTYSVTLDYVASTNP